MNFLKNLLAAILGNLIAFGFIFVLLIMGIAGLATFTTAAPDGKKTIQEQSILRLQLNETILDRLPSIEQFNVSLGLEPEAEGLDQILHSIQEAATDENIAGISLESQFIQAGWSQTRSIRRALQAFKKTGKFIYAYGDFFSQKSYYLASVADSIFLNPVGQIDFKGLSSEVLYYKDFQDQYGVKMEVIRLGKYKSAVEPFLDNEMSPENRKQIQTLLDDIWEVVAEEIAESRSLTPYAIDQAANNLEGNTAARAKKARLVDALSYEAAYHQKLKARLTETEALEFVRLRQLGTPRSKYDADIKDRIAVLYAQGTILYGDGNETIIGKTTFLEALDEALDNVRVKALVLRVDSPGGDALTSEILWERLHAAKEKKPLIVSMGDVAASGGYYISLPAQKIVADPLTVTGSIGVWATLPNIEGLSKEIGINAEQVSTHDNAMGYSPFEKTTQGFRNAAKESIEQVYTTFKTHVSDDRNMDLTDVEAVAQGRVWSGTRAFQNGLVDGLGDLQTAVQMAADVAGLKSYNVVSYPNIEPSLETILEASFPMMQAQWQSQLPDYFKALLQTTKLNDRRLQLQTQLPFELTIR
ncbi:MAG: signal peptide peptidase SppA [Flavobacteriaceae bacterium]